MITTEKFNLGDIVRVNRSSYDYKRCGENLGKIMQIGSFYHCVEFSKYIEGGLDPFGEETWGFEEIT